MERPIRPAHVAIYIRWSTEDQGDGTTLAVQSEACNHYLLSQGWQVRTDLTFIDDGYSGGSLDRPALTRLRAAVKAGEVDCVVVFRLDRLSRSVIDTVTLVLQEWADLTHLKSAREPVDTTTAMGRQFFYMLVSYAEWERNVIRERMFSGKLRRAKEGRSPGMPAAFGYRTGSTPGALEIVEDEAAIVQLVFAWAEHGVSARQIARRLTERGYPTRGGGPWGASLITKMLRNPLYTGRLVWGRRRQNPRYGKAPGERKFLTAEPYASVAASAVEAIIPQAQFDQIQAILAGRRGVAPGAVGSPHLLTGLLRCATCDHPMQYNGYRTWAYYRCAARAQTGSCTAGSIPADWLEREIAHLVARRFGQRVLAEARTVADGRRAEAEAHLRSALAATAAAVDRLAGQERRIDQDYRQGRLSAADRQALLAAVGDERGRLLQSMAQLEARVRQVGPVQLPEPGEVWTALTAVQRKQILRLLLGEVRAKRDAGGGVRLELTWTGVLSPA